MVENDWRDERLGCGQNNGRCDLPPRDRVCLQPGGCDCEGGFVRRWNRGNTGGGGTAEVGVEADTPTVAPAEDGHCVDGRGPNEPNERVGTPVGWAKPAEFGSSDGF